MKIKRTTLSTQLKDLYGDDGYQSHIEVGREYWWYFSNNSDIGEKHGPGWYKIKVTYIRSKCLFYVFSDYSDMEESFCPVNCFMAASFVFADFDPVKDLGDKLINVEVAKLTMRFDDERTIIKNWPNTELYMEVEDNTELWHNYLANVFEYYIEKQ
jgi:hypothetical protein